MTQINKMSSCLRISDDDNNYHNKKNGDKDNRFDEKYKNNILSRCFDKLTDMYPTQLSIYFVCNVHTCDYRFENEKERERVDIFQHNAQTRWNREQRMYLPTCM